MISLHTPIDYEAARNRFLAEFAEGNDHISDEQLRETLEAIVHGGDAYLALDQLHTDNQVLLRLLAAPTLLGELQRRLECRELESD